MTDTGAPPAPRVCALGAYAAETARERFGPDGTVNLADVASLVTLDAFCIALHHPEYVAAMVAEHDRLMRAQNGDAVADAIAAALVARAEATVRQIPVSLQEGAP